MVFNLFTKYSGKVSQRICLVVYDTTGMHPYSGIETDATILDFDSTDAGIFRKHRIAE